MRTSKKDRFITIRSEGGLLPLDFLERVALLDQEISGLTPSDYHLLEHEKINEAINRAWDRLLGCWVSFKSATRNASEDDPLIRETRERWLLPIFDALGYGRLTPCKSMELDGRSFQISHMWQKVPMHLVGAGVELDRRTAGVAGAAKSAPHGMVQDFLNHSDEHLWAFVSNGRKLRIIRDNVSLTRQAFVEFDLEGMMDGEQFSDFRLLFLLCHQSRVEQEQSQDFWLERWTSAAQLGGVRVREELGRGVEEAISAIGTGFLQHPSNSELRSKLKSGKLSAQDFYRQILRTVYRLLFLFVAEDRGALLRRETSIEARRTYTDYYSTQRIREMAGSRKGSHHHDLWQLLRLVFESLGQESGCPELALPALGSFLWSRDSVKEIAGCELSNRNFLGAVFALAFTEEGKSKRAVDFKNLRTEELGSVYEALLEMHPHVDLEVNKFGLFGASGSERKTTGSYYTPASLVSCLIDSTMNPMIEKISKRTNAKDLLLDLRICDPACGSGHFLLAAANRLARALAAARSEDAEASPESYKVALRDVISHCIYGVDVNEMSVELCKVNLWLESVDSERPLSFLDNRIKCGNSLIGASPELVTKGIVDDAFDPIIGDDKGFAKEVKKANKEQSTRQGSIGQLQDRSASFETLQKTSSRIGAKDESSLLSVRRKQNDYVEYLDSHQFKSERMICDSWCASFVWRLEKSAPQAITRNIFFSILQDYRKVPVNVISEVERLREEYKFFHWHLEFPEVFFQKNESDTQTTRTGGFDIVIGNPPWEQLQLDDREFFAARSPAIAAAQHMAARNKLVKLLEKDNPALFAEYMISKRVNEGVQHFVHSSGRYPLTSFGRLNSAPLFAELGLQLVKQTGITGLVLPTGIATDSFNQHFFRYLVESGRLCSLYDFENRKAIFPGVHRSYKFCLLTAAGSNLERNANFAFFLLDVQDLSEPEKVFQLSRDEIQLINPNTTTCPIFRSRVDANITKRIYERVPIILAEGGTKESPWGFDGMLMFMMNTGSELFKTRKELEEEGCELRGNVFINKASDATYVPLYEGKMIHQYDHRWSTYNGLELADISHEMKSKGDFVVLPRYWVPKLEVSSKLAQRWEQDWLIGWRDICRSTDERTLIASLIPVSGCGDTILLMLPEKSSGKQLLCLLACLNSLVCDYVARQKVGGTHLKFHVFKQLPVLPPESYDRVCPWSRGESLLDWISASVSQLTGVCVSTSGELAWKDDARINDLVQREDLQRRLDSAFFLLYGLDVNDVEFVLETFPIIRDRELKAFGNFRTKNLVLKHYTEMSESFRELQCV